MSSPAGLGWQLLGARAEGSTHGQGVWPEWGPGQSGWTREDPEPTQILRTKPGPDGPPTWSSHLVLPRHKVPTVCGRGGGGGLGVPPFPHLQNGGKASSWETSGGHQPPSASSSVPAWTAVYRSRCNGGIPGRDGSRLQRAHFVASNRYGAETSEPTGAPGGAQSVKRPTSAQVMISRSVGSSPASGSVLMAHSLEPAWDSVSPSLSAPPLLVLSLSKIHTLFLSERFSDVAQPQCSTTITSI